MKGSTLSTLALLCLCCALSPAQAPVSNPTKSSVVPNLVKFNGAALEPTGEPINGVLGITFSLYQTEQGGLPLWHETQNVTADNAGRYTVSLGASEAEGIPTELFVNGDARWLGVQIEGRPEARRVLLLSVPYALKAADAETIGGLPPSAFVLAKDRDRGLASAFPGSASVNVATPAVTLSGAGTANYLPLWTSASALGNSALFQYGAGTTARLGLNTTTPATTLDVNGTSTFRGSLNLPPLSAATAAAGFASQSLLFTASAFNSATHSANNQVFQWKVEPLSNNTSAPAAALNLLAGSGTTSPAETGLKIARNGVITFAPGQTFPGSSGSGTITGVTAGTGLTGGGTAGAVKLSVDTTKVPLLAATNTFTQPQTISAGIGGLTVTSTGTAVNGAGNVGLYGATTVAGGNSNGVLGHSSNATAVRGDDTGSGSGLVGTSSTGFGVYGFSTNGTAVYGTAASTSGISINPSAIVGDSANSSGVTGISQNSAGVVAINRHSGNGLTAVNQGSGFGIYASAATLDADNGVGVRGESFGTKVSVNGGPDGVQGLSHSALGSGVAGINDAYGGAGITGVSTNSGFGFSTPSNVTQGRGAGGWAKALLYVDPFATGGVAITRCYNSQATGAAVYTPPCGFNITHNGQGDNTIDFGFEVDDRYVMATSNGFQTTIAAFQRGAYFHNINSNQVEVLTNYLANNSALDGVFTLILF